MRKSKKKTHCSNVFCRQGSDEACAACQEKIVSQSLIYHVSMTLIKAVVGVITGSKVLVAEALHSFSDCFAFGINYCGTRTAVLSVFVQSFAIGAIMFLSGVWICADNTAIIMSRIPGRPGLFALLVAGISVVANGYLYMVSVCTHQRDAHNSNVFMFMVQNRTNLYAAGFGFLGILFAVMGLVYFDPVGAIFIGCFQVHGALQIFRECFEKKQPKGSWSKKHMSLALGGLSLGIILLFTCRVLDTFDRRQMLLIPAEGGTFDSPVSSLLGRAPYFCIIDLKKRTTTFSVNPSRYYNVDESRVLAAAVKDQGVGVVLAGKVGPKMFSVLRDNNARIYYFNTAGTVASAFSDYRGGRLQMATSANSVTGFGRSQVRWMGPW
ncbi:MAG: cation transporter [Candidatus Omnitrophica bacterium]|nr:cation transporter [Candidatus Omnitrophota bacterium]